MQDKLSRTAHRTSAAFPLNPKKGWQNGTKEAACTAEMAQSTHTNEHSVRSINGNRIRAAKKNLYLDKRGRMSNRARAGSRKCWIAKELNESGATWSYRAGKRKDLEKPMPSDHSNLRLRSQTQHGRNPNHGSTSWKNTGLLRLIQSHVSVNETLKYWMKP